MILSFIVTIVVICLSIFCLTPKPIDYSDAELVPLWKAIETVDRTSMGFTPVSKYSKIHIERANGGKYDVMLHIYHHTSRTIAFRKEDENYYWIGEQEIFEGPNQYSTHDGTSYERITLTFHKERIGGLPTNVLSISYSGEDSRLNNNRHDLTLSNVQPILQEWKYGVSTRTNPN